MDESSISSLVNDFKLNRSLWELNRRQIERDLGECFKGKPKSRKKIPSREQIEVVLLKIQKKMAKNFNGFKEKLEGLFTETRLLLV